jgi:SpoVK/Ycf46/Vps4 family AAA+-type ATPase
MTLFSQNGTIWKPHREEALSLKKYLTAGNYTVKQDEFKQFFLEAVDPFTVPDRFYGDLTQKTNRIIRTFADRPATTGVLLSGEKGSGKTLLAKNVCYSLAKVGVPTILINTPYVGDEFNTFLQTIAQPAVIFFDEFEKVYKREIQEYLLTLLDGTFASKKLFLLTCNDQYRVDHHMKNRPGRIYYAMNFNGLAEEFIREYLEENLDDQEQVERVVAITRLFGKFNFDMLQSIVEEMNRYGEAPADVIELLNAKPEHDEGCKYDVQVWYKGDRIANENLTSETFIGNPFGPGGFEVEYRTDDPDDPEQSRWYEDEFTQADFVNYDQASNTFVFEKPNVRVALTKAQTTARFSYHAF